MRFSCTATSRQAWNCNWRNICSCVSTMYIKCRRHAWTWLDISRLPIRRTCSLFRK